MTQDSIGLGEDGPTHQPVEHLAALRAIPHLGVYRPGDAVEARGVVRVRMQGQDRTWRTLRRRTVPWKEVPGPGLTSASAEAAGPVLASVSDAGSNRSKAPGVLNRCSRSASQGE
jgi:transketolase